MTAIKSFSWIQKQEKLKQMSTTAPRGKATISVLMLVLSEILCLKLEM